MVIIGILAATVISRINFGATSSTASVAGAAYMIASDIRYAQQWAMATRNSRIVSFTSGQSSYITTTPVGTWSVGISAGGLPKTITVVNYTGKVSIS
jgi:Tfp pilus assembly protein FimT